MRKLRQEARGLRRWENYGVLPPTPTSYAKATEVKRLRAGRRGVRRWKIGKWGDRENGEVGG